MKSLLEDLKKIGNDRILLLVILFLVGIYITALYVVGSNFRVIFFIPGIFLNIYFTGWLVYMFGGGHIMYKPENEDFYFHLIGEIFSLLIILLSFM